jgi:hypothetical protein
VERKKSDIEEHGRKRTGMKMVRRKEILCLWMLNLSHSCTVAYPDGEV